MENVWTNFKTDEETFKLIMKYEEDFVKTIVQKKYGINYDNKDEVKLTKKENEIFALASLLIEIDVLCIKNLKNKHINIDSFFKKEEGLMQRKICTAYDLQIDKLENIIIRLPEEQRKIFIYSYGINRRKMSFKDIEKLFEVSTDDIYKSLLLTIRRLKSEVNIMKSVKKVTNKIPTMLMLDLEKRGYPRSELIEALNLYDDKTKLFEQHDGFFKLPHLDVDSIPISDFPLYDNWSYDRIYRNDMIKQPDVLMFMLLFISKFSQEQLKANYEYYEPCCIHESSLSPSVHSILASQLKKDDEAYDFFGFATRLDLDNYNRNTNQGIHTTSIAAAWMNIVYGFGGLRSDGEKLSVAPSIPKNWGGYSFNISYKGVVIEIKVDKENVYIKTKGDGVVELNVYGKDVEINSEGYKCEVE